MQWLKEEEDFSYFNIKISNIFNIKLKFALLLQKIITYSCPINMMSFNDTKVDSFYFVIYRTCSGAGVEFVFSRFEVRFFNINFKCKANTKIDINTQYSP